MPVRYEDDGVAERHGATSRCINAELALKAADDQVGDAPRMDADFLTIRRHHSRLPGEGDLDVAGFLRAVLVTGYIGPISLEIFNENASGSPLEIAHAAMNSLLRVEDRALVSKD